MKPIFIALMLATTAQAAEMHVTRDLNYAESNTPRQTLDVYAPAEAKNLPVMIWIHGGGWRIGNKRFVQEKPQAFVDQGFVFVSMNYRFRPQVEMDALADDVATAIKWVHDHIAEHGGNPQQIFLAGHSAGAHLTALVGTDESYLRKQGLSFANLQGCIPVDTAVYDVPQLMEMVSSDRAELYRNAFGKDAASQRKYSPITHVEKGNRYPPFLLLHVALRRDARLQCQAFAEKLRDAGGEVEIVSARGKSHATINKELGTEGDAPTKAVFEFLHQRIKETSEKKL